VSWHISEKRTWLFRSLPEDGSEGGRSAALH